MSKRQQIDFQQKAKNLDFGVVIEEILLLDFH
jgi:hypothetical protein